MVLGTDFYGENRAKRKPHRTVVECDVEQGVCSEVNTELQQLQALEDVFIELSIAGESVIQALDINLNDLPWMTYRQLQGISRRIREFIHSMDPETLDEMSLENSSVHFRLAIIEIIDQIAEARRALIRSLRTGLEEDIGRVRRDLAMVLSANVNGQIVMLNQAVTEQDERIYELLIDSIRQLREERQTEKKKQRVEAEIRKWEEILSLPDNDRRIETVREIRQRASRIIKRFEELGH